jgi:hypothetical protein
MNFKPTEEQRAWQERAERLARETLAPRAAAMEARGRLPEARSNHVRRV